MPYIVNNPMQWVSRSSVGDGECVALVHAAVKIPQTKLWNKGQYVLLTKNLTIGTVIATFDKAGKYPTVGERHAAIYLGLVSNGIRVIDQWNNRDKAGNIISKQNPHERIIRVLNPTTHLVDHAEAYFVVN